MKLLPDTHLLLWAVLRSHRLSPAARALLKDTSKQLLFSAVSLWEVAIKRSLGRADFTVEARVLRRGLIDQDYEELPATSEHSLAIENLPLIHKDPFDRLLIAQATVEGITLLTANATIARYPGPIRRV